MKPFLLYWFILIWDYEKRWCRQNIEEIINLILYAHRKLYSHVSGRFQNERIRKTKKNWKNIYVNKLKITKNFWRKGDVRCWRTKIIPTKFLDSNRRTHSEVFMTHKFLFGNQFKNTLRFQKPSGQIIQKQRSSLYFA